MLKHPRKIMVAICDEIGGMLWEVFPSGLFYHVRVPAKCLGTVGLKCFEPGRDLLPLGAGGPPKVAFGVVPPIGMLSTGSGKGCHLLGLGDCLGTSVGEMAAVGCSSMGEVLCIRMSGGDRGVCPSRIWHEAARAPLSNGWLLYKTTWQAESKSLWLKLSSPMACSSRSFMYSPCSLWSIAAWESFWASASQMALEQVDSASWTKWPLVVLASLTAAK